MDRLQEKIDSLNEHQEQLRGYREELQQSGEDQLSLTDPDARAMHPSTHVGVGYNIQIAVDAKHKLIVEQQVHSKVTDLGLLAETAKAAQETLDVDTIDLVADKGYFAIEDIEACEAAGIIPHVPKPKRGPAVRNGFFTKEQFRFDAEANVYHCPAGHQLTRRCRNKVREGVYIIVYKAKTVCKTCPLKSQCTKASERRVSRYENEAVLEKMADRLASRPEVIKQRKEIVEHPFGSIKQWMNQGAFLMRRIENVRGEFSLTSLAYNLRRAINLVGIAGLIAAVGA